MIIVRIQGGLGNQLFQFHLGNFIKVRFKREVKFDTSWFDQEHHKEISRELLLLQLGLLQENEIDNSNLELIKKKAKIPNFFNNDLLPEVLKKGIYKIFKFFIPYYYYYDLSYEQVCHFSKKNKNIVFDGYWQDKRYLISNGIELDELRYQLENKNQLFRKIFINISKINSVSIHVRRGDYLNPKNQELFEEIPFFYFKSAVQAMLQKNADCTFFIFSDDKIWVQKELKISNACYVNGMNTIEDFLLMNACKGHIITNSTFSWWAAMLNFNSNKDVYMPQKWFRVEKVKNELLQVKTWNLL